MLWFDTFPVRPECLAQQGVSKETNGKHSPRTDLFRASLGGELINVGRVRHAVCAVTRQPCRQALLKNRRCVAAQRLAGYAKGANPPYIWP